MRRASTLSQSILQRIFDFYAESLLRDTSGSPFATPETLIQVCRHWRDTGERHESIWAKVYITLIDGQDVKTWISRIHRHYTRAQFLTDISIQDQRTILSPKSSRTGAGRFSQIKTGGIMAHLRDADSLITAVHRTPSRCRYKNSRLRMSPNVFTIIHRLDGNARALASSHLNGIFDLNLRSLESLELENIKWVTLTLPDSIRHSFHQYSEALVVH